MKSQLDVCGAPTRIPVCGTSPTILKPIRLPPSGQNPCASCGNPRGVRKTGHLACDECDATVLQGRRSFDSGVGAYSTRVSVFLICPLRMVTAKHDPLAPCSTVSAVSRSGSHVNPRGSAAAMCWRCDSARHRLASRGKVGCVEQCDLNRAAFNPMPSISSSPERAKVVAVSRNLELANQPRSCGLARRIVKGRSSSRYVTSTASSSNQRTPLSSSFCRACRVAESQRALRPLRRE